MLHCFKVYKYKLFFLCFDASLLGEDLITHGEATSFLSRLSNTFSDIFRTNQSMHLIRAIKTMQYDPIFTRCSARFLH